LFALAAGLLTVAFRRNRAQVRYWLWFSASFKFFVPFSLLLSLGAKLETWAPAAKTIAPQAVSFTIVQIARPFTGGVSFVPPAQETLHWVPLVIFGVWACGFAAIALTLLRGWLSIRAAMRHSYVLEIPAPLEVRTSPGLLEPGVVGFLHPVLLLPEGIVDRLTPSQLEAVLAHELCHVRRRDNLFASIHMLVEAIFWFHPLVWWIGARLVEERERACDEAVLSLASEPRIYADAILNVCRLYVESPLRCVSGVTGSDLKKRIEAIMTNPALLKLNFGKKLLLAAAAMLAVSGPLLVGLMKAQSETPLAFEVASVKQDTRYSFVRRPWTPNIDCAPIAHCGISGNKFNDELASLTDLIMDAYNVRRYQISGLPDWGDSGHDVYDVAAKVDGDRTPTLAEVRRMLQTLLANRFQLKLHHETRELPVYALVAAKNGPKIVPKQEACFLATAGSRSDGGRGALKAGDDGRTRSPLSAWSMLPEMLGMYADRPVIDKTGLDAPYYCLPDGNDANMEVILPLSRAAGPGRGAATRDRSTIPDADSDAPSIFDLVQEKLGLKLEPQKGPVDILVIDHVARPSEN
jgi:uncharacterized protein (TIGR03435 family)